MSKLWLSKTGKLIVNAMGQLCFQPACPPGCGGDKCCGSIPSSVCVTTTSPNPALSGMQGVCVFPGSVTFHPAGGDITFSVACALPRVCSLAGVVDPNPYLRWADTLSVNIVGSTNYGGVTFNIVWTPGAPRTEFGGESYFSYWTGQSAVTSRGDILTLILKPDVGAILSSNMFAFNEGTPVMIACDPLNMYLPFNDGAPGQAYITGGSIGGGCRDYKASVGGPGTGFLGFNVVGFPAAGCTCSPLSLDYGPVTISGGTISFAVSPRSDCP